MKDENYYVIQGWMINKLKLKGNELLVYSVIYGFSQIADQKYRGGLKYLQETTNGSRPTVMKSLKTLTEKGLLLKESETKNHITLNQYKAADLPGGKETLQLTGKETCPPPGKETCPNSINAKDINKKNKYGEFKNVLLTKEEHEKLSEKVLNRDKWIQEMDEAIELKGYKYKSHYLAIQKWADKAGEKKHQKENITPFTRNPLIVAEGYDDSWRYDDKERTPEEQAEIEAAIKKVKEEQRAI